MYDATMDGLLRSGLIYMSAVDQDCPNPEVLAAYYEHSLEAKEAASFESHLSQCGCCRKQLAMMVRADETPAQPARQSFWLWDWRLLSPAVAALLILTVWAFRHSPPSAMNHRQSDQPLVAMSRSPQAAPSNAPVPEPPATPPTGAQPTLIAPQAAEQIAPKAKSELQTETPAIEKQLRSPQPESAPVNGRNFKDLQALTPSPKPTDRRDEVAELKKDTVQNEAAPAAPPAPSAMAPRAMSAARAANPQGALAERQSAPPAAEADEAAKSQNSPAVRKAEPQLKTFATANAVAGAVAQAPVQHSGSTIIPTPDPKIMWRVAGGNFVERTENGGSSWEGQAADPDAQLTAGSAPSNKTCWLVGKAGMILVTKDAQHWKKLPPPIPADFVAVDAKNNSSATVTAADGQKFSTENEGKKWVPVKP
jgi:hypothetical protein